MADVYKRPLTKEEWFEVGKELLPHIEAIAGILKRRDLGGLSTSFSGDYRSVDYFESDSGERKGRTHSMIHFEKNDHYDVGEFFGDNGTKAIVIPEEGEK